MQYGFTIVSKFLERKDGVEDIQNELVETRHLSAIWN